MAALLPPQNHTLNPLLRQLLRAGSRRPLLLETPHRRVPEPSGTFSPP